jgi:hypothetical protein
VSVVAHDPQWRKCGNLGFALAYGRTASPNHPAEIRARQDERWQGVVAVWVLWIGHSLCLLLPFRLASGPLLLPGHR